MATRKPHLFTVGVFAIAVSAIGNGSFAQQPVGAGGVIQQIPPPPVVERPSPSLPIEQRKGAGVPVTDTGAKIFVTALHVVGETLFSEAELIESTGFKAGSELSLGELRGMAAKIIDRYNQSGYFLAQAYLPQQEIKGGVVTIAVAEGHYGQISVQNQSRVSDGLIDSVLGGLSSPDPIQTAPLERRLLIISDIPGVDVKATMSPGAAVGTSDLVVSLAPTPRVTGSLQADNWGNQYTGSYRLGATINVNNLLGYGDVLSLRTLDSTTGGLFYGRVSYQAQVQDVTLGVAYTAFAYRLGRQFSSLHASGYEEIASAYASYPIIRSYNTNLYGMVDVDYRIFQDKIGATSSVSDKSAVVLIASLSGDHHDSVLGGGWDNYSIAATVGSLDIHGAAARRLDASTAQTNSGYAKLSGSVSRLQHLVGPLSLYGVIRGQIATKNLDISEKMELGGATGVRAYPEDEAYGDDGYVATQEARLLLPKWSESLPGQMQLIGFVDTGYVRQNHSPWLAGRNSATRSGAGVGVIWSLPNDWLVTATYAHKIGGETATSAPDRGGCFWLQIVKYF